MNDKPNQSSNETIIGASPTPAIPETTKRNGLISPISAGADPIATVCPAVAPNPTLATAPKEVPSISTLYGPAPITNGPAPASTDTLVGSPRITSGPARASTALGSSGTLVGAVTPIVAVPGRNSGIPILPTPDPRNANQAKLRIPGYELLDKIGQGGMGVVYKARQVQLNRIVALKMILSGSHSSRDDDERFIQEAELIARLKHPNVVQVYEFGVNPYDCKPFFSLEFIEGGSLANRLRAEPQPAAQSAHMVETLARAMQAAHDQGIIHRDLKPDNVLLAPVRSANDGAGIGDMGIPKITDFGLAKHLDSDDGQTRTGAVMGTPSYMAPEQAAGKTKEIGPASDQYALGTILYEMLTGRPPFKGTTVWDTVKMVIDVEPLPARQLNAGVPRDLETICLKCLQKSPSKRYPSCAELADDLRRWQNGEPVHARRITSFERVIKWARRKPYQALFTSAVALLLMFVAGLGFYLQAQKTAKYKEMYERSESANKVEKEVKLDESDARTAEELKDWPKAKNLLEKALAVLAANPDLQADQLRADLTQRLQEADKGVAALERIQRFRPFYDKAVFHESPATGLDVAGNRVQAREAAASALAIHHLDQETDLLEQDKGYLSAKEFNRLVQRAYELQLIRADVEAAPSPDENDTDRKARAARGLQLLSRAARLGAKYQFDTQIYHIRKARYTALARGEKVAAGLPSEAPPKPNGALDWFLKGLESYRRAEQAKQPKAADDGYAAARAECSEALESQEDHFWARYVRAMCQLKLRNWSDAKSDLTVCLDRRPDFPWPRLLRGFVSSELGHGYKSKAELAAAEADFNKALSQSQDPVVQYAGLNNRGVLFIRQQRWDEAIADLRAAVRLRPDQPAGYINLAKAYDGAKQFDEAIATLDHAVKLAPTVAALYDVRSAVHLERNDRQAACGDLRQAIANWRKGATDRPVEKLHEVLGKLLIDDKKYDEALKSLAAALEIDSRNEIAYRLQAEALLALNRRHEAAQALDNYFALATKPPAALCKARGLIHTQYREYAGAVAMYTRALISAPNDSEALGLRGWVYLLLDAARPALDDFEHVLKTEPNNADALAGRGNARVRLRQVKDAIADAEAALKQGPKTDRLLYNVASIYSLAVAQVEMEVRTGKDRQAPNRLAVCEGKAIACLELTLEARTPNSRTSFWSDVVQKDPVLEPIRRSPKFEQLAVKYRGK